MRQSTKTTFIVTRGFRAFLPCRAAVVPPDPQLRGGHHPPPPGLGRVPVAEAQPGQQALLVLAYLRKGETFAELAAGFGVGTATACTRRNKPESQKEANRAHAKLRAPGEARERPAQELENPPQAPLLPLARRTTSQGHPRPGDPCGITRMKKAHSNVGVTCPVHWPVRALCRFPGAISPCNGPSPGHAVGSVAGQPTWARRDKETAR